MKQKIMEIYMDDSDEDNVVIRLENVLPDNQLAQNFFEKFLRIAHQMKAEGDQYNENLHK